MCVCTLCNFVEIIWDLCSIDLTNENFTGAKIGNALQLLYNFNDFLFFGIW